MENTSELIHQKDQDTRRRSTNKIDKQSLKKKYTFRELSKELSHKPHILKFILYLQKCLKKRKKALKKIKEKLEKLVLSKPTTNNASIQTENELESNKSIDINNSFSWNVNNEENVSLVDQVKEAAENALQQTGMVYEETSGMYYDYNTGYYYNANTGLYYHSSTGCYYYYDKDQSTFVFHSQADISDFPMQNEDFDKKRNKKSKSKAKVKKEKQPHKEEASNNNDSIIEKDKENLHKRSNDETKSDVKRIKLVQDCLMTDLQSSNDKELQELKSTSVIDTNNLNVDIESKVNNLNQEIDSTDCSSTCIKSDGECSSSDEESSSSSSNESNSSRYPPCVRIIVSETSLSKLKIGSLFILTKEGGTLGREGDHAILIPEENISKHHLTFVYNEECSSYYVKDVGSRNGTILNGTRMSLSKKESDLCKVVHGSVIQLASTKLLCHIHKGNDTCGHCEPGLLMKDDEPTPKIYKPINLKALHKKELRRLKEKYQVKPVKTDGGEEKLLPEGYEDKAQMRREAVGSTHDSVKTEQASLETTISSENKGFKLLQKMGWSVGDGLGKTSQGTIEPVALLSNQGTSGLGTGSLNVSTSSLSNQIPMRRQAIWLAAQKRYDKASTSSVFKQDESDDEEQIEKE